MGSGCSRSENAQSLDNIIVQNKLKWQKILKFSFQFQNLQFSYAENIYCTFPMEQGQ